MERLQRLGINGAFVAVSTLFFAWGFIASNNDPLIVALRAAFQLTYSEALRIQLVSFLANGLMSLPAAALGNRLSPVNTILLALTTMACGSLAVVSGLAAGSFTAVLGALFIQAAGITVLQVAANPLAAALGPPESSHFRLNLAQTLNSLGVVIGVNYGAAVMLGERAFASSSEKIANAAERRELLGAVDDAFLTMAAMIACLAVFVLFQRQRIASAVPPGDAVIGKPSILAALRSRWALFGALVIGLYVGAEVSIGSVMIAFLHDPAIMGIPMEQGGFFLANFYWGGALVGRIVGSLLLIHVPAGRLLAVCAGMATLLCAIALGAFGPLSGWAALGVGLFNSVMFPTIFSISLQRSGVSRSATSGLLVLAIACGALLPYAVAHIADTSGLASAFAIPALAYLAILLFALRASAAEGHRAV